MDSIGEIDLVWPFTAIANRVDGIAAVNEDKKMRNIAMALNNEEIIDKIMANGYPDDWKWGSVCNGSILLLYCKSELTLFFINIIDLTFWFMV